MDDRIKTKPDYEGNILTKDLQELEDGTLFYEHVFDGIAEESTLYKKMKTCKPYKDWPEGDVTIQAMTCGQFSGVPGEIHRLGYTNEDEKEWRVVSEENIQKMVGWLMTTKQFLES